MARSASLLGYVLLIATSLGWAGAWLTARLAAHDAPALTVTVGRFVVAAVALVPVWLALDRGKGFSPTRGDWLVLAGMAVTGAILYTVLFLLGVQRAPASDGAILVPALSGIFAMTFSAMAARAFPPARAVVGACLSLGGVLLVGWSALGASALDPGRLVGISIFVGSAIVWGVYTLLGRRAAQRVPPVTGILLMAFLAALLLLPVALVVDGVPDLASWTGPAVLNVLYLGIFATALAFVTFYAAVKLIGVDRTAPALGLVPIFGVAGAALLLGETLTWHHFVGALLVLSGIALPAVWRAKT